MAVLKIYLKNYVKSEPGFNEALGYCMGRLQYYFNSCIALTDRRLFSQARVIPNPPAPAVTDWDLLVYVLANPSFSFIPGFATQGVAGKTKWDQAGVICEIFAKRAWEEATGLFGTNRTTEGNVLANAAFHEIAHNKWHGLPQIERNKFKVPNTADDVHNRGSVFKGMPTEGELGKLEPTREDMEFMAALIQHPVKQWTAGIR
jgi:hypothetical protein